MSGGSRRLRLPFTQLAFVPAEAIGEPYRCRWYVFVDGRRRFRLLCTERAGCWYAEASGRIVRLGTRDDAEKWVVDSLVAEHLRRGAALH